ncbi:hypothetical protein [Streptomyces griseosporeus]|uniref:hypothetical protein n=1 Tax=Streptomyces griseosporeus TaxID=1910 RepID=UPI0036FDFEE0
MGEAGKGDGRSPLDTALDELYGTPPSAFVTRRTLLAAAAKADGRPDDARRIRAARRPTLAAWAANLLLRAEPEESRGFLELGRALREAYRSLDATAIGELSEQRRRIVAALTRQAAQHARDAGQQLSDAVRQDVEATLRAVLTDAQAADQWATGRLETALTPPSDFPTDTTPEARPPRQPPAPPPPPPARSSHKDELAERRRQRQERLEQARRAAEEAQRRLDDRRADHQDADTALQRAVDDQDRARHQRDGAQRQSAAAEEQLRQAQEAHRAAQEQLNEAQEELRHAERERREAERRAHTTAEAVTRAEREAREAAQQLKRLTRRGG